VIASQFILTTGQDSPKEEQRRKRQIGKIVMRPKKAEWIGSASSSSLKGLPCFINTTTAVQLLESRLDDQVKAVCDQDQLIFNELNKRGM
jgi:hypothetical protein